MAVQKRLNRSRCRFGCGLRWAQGTMYYMGVKIPHEKEHFFWGGGRTCPSVYPTILCGELCKLAKPVEIPFGLWTRVGRGIPCMGAHWRRLANTAEPSVCRGDAALGPLSNYFDHLLLWAPNRIGHTIVFCSCAFFFLSSFSSPILSGRRLDVYHTSTHDVALVRI